MQRPRWFPALAVAAIVVASGGCIGGELGTDHVETKFESAVRLSQEAPVVSRHVTFIADAAPAASDARIDVRVSRARPDGVYERPDAVSVSVRPDDPAVVRPQGPPYEPVPGARLGVIGSCREGCELGVTIVARSTSPDPIDLRLLAEMTVDCPVRCPAQPRKGATSHLGRHRSCVRRNPACRGRYGARLGRGHAVTTLGPSRRHVHAPASAIAGRRSYPLVGSLVVRGVGDERTHELLAGRSDYWLGYLSLGSLSTPLASEGGDTEIDWLGACPDTGDCSVTVGIDLSFERLMGAARQRAGTRAQDRRPTRSGWSWKRQRSSRHSMDGRSRWRRDREPDSVKLRRGTPPISPGGASSATIPTRSRWRRVRPAGVVACHCTVLSIGAVRGTLQREIVAWEATRAQGPNGSRQRRRQRPSSPSARTSRASAVAAKGRPHAPRQGSRRTGPRGSPSP